MEGKEMTCYICDKISIFYCKNILLLTSKSSSTPIYKFFEKFIDPETIPCTEDQVICQECLLKIEEYDLALTTAQKYEKELKELLQKKLQKFNEKENYDKEIETKTKIILKCNQCSVVFSNINDITSHTHSIKEEDEIIEITDAISEFTESEDIFESDVSCYYLMEEDDKIIISTEEETNNIEKLSSPITKSQIKIENETLNSHTCILCDSTFLEESDYKKHLKVHAENSQFVCCICGSLFKTKSSMEKHEMTAHKKSLNFECNVCQKTFTQKNALQRHMTIHTGVKPIQCEKCGKQFIHHSSFYMHKLAHDNIREKKCDICGLRLRSNSHLSRHKRVHSGEKPYSCPTCGQKFAQRYNMMTHYKVHQGIHRPTKTHKCTECNSNFKSKAKLQDHIKSVHEETKNIKFEPINESMLGPKTTLVIWENSENESELLGI